MLHKCRINPQEDKETGAMENLGFSVSNILPLGTCLVDLRLKRSQGLIGYYWQHFELRKGTHKSSNACKVLNE